MKDETFPELGAGGDDAESVCSCAERDRDGDAFPKAFERDLVTPTNMLSEHDHENVHTEVRSAEERRRSMLDHHWAIPSKDRSLDGEDTPPTSAPLMPTIKDETDTLTKQSCHDSGMCKTFCFDVVLLTYFQISFLVEKARTLDFSYISQNYTFRTNHFLMLYGKLQSVITRVSVCNF